MALSRVVSGIFNDPFNEWDILIAAFGFHLVLSCVDYGRNAALTTSGFHRCTPSHSISPGTDVFTYFSVGGPRDRCDISIAPKQLLLLRGLN